MADQEIRRRVQALLDDQSAGWRYLRSKGFRVVGETGNRWRSPDGGLYSFRNAVRVAVIEERV
jgi:hypothetical protein